VQRVGAWLGLLVFVGHQAFRTYLKLALNSWYESFYDTMQSASPTGSGSGPAADRASLRDAVAVELEKFVWIVAPAVVVHPMAGLLRQTWIFAWRMSLIKSYLFQWDTAVLPIEGASQRIHEDTSRFASGVQGCVANVLDSVFTLVAFCPVLWELDEGLFAAAFATAVGGVAVSWAVGYPLVGLEVNNQAVEAELRRDLVLLEATPDVFQHPPPRAFQPVLTRLTINYARLYAAFAALQTWLSSFEQASVILPYVLVAPRLFDDNASGRLTLGQLMKTTNAFDKVFSSLNVVSDSWLAITEFRSVLRRLREFERAQATGRTARAQLVPPDMELSDAVPASAADTGSPPPLSPTHRL